ncbi:MAG: YdeI/OmpD-associated family protein [Chitinophagales bacterium]|nr:YdeI/OmpD-associated family protein [Chitinophagales bacterium]
MENLAIFYPPGRSEWRQWLLENHRIATEVWLKTYNKASGIPSIPYDDMVEECLCFGWIDGVVKKFEPESMVQRITPRRKKTFLSELNRQRIWKLQQNGLMTPAGIEPLKDQIGSPNDPLVIPEWIAARLQEDEQVWENFQSFTHFYKRLKIGWITEIKGASRQPEVEKRLNYLIKMTREGKTYGTQPLEHVGDFLPESKI